MRRVFNTTLTARVITQSGKKILGCTFAVIDISEPRVLKLLNRGVLVLVNEPTPAPTEPEPQPEPEPEPEAARVNTEPTEENTAPEKTSGTEETPNPTKTKK